MPNSSPRPDGERPDRDSPAWTALADQLDMAAQHARRVATRMIDGCGGRLLGVTEREGPWAQALFDTVNRDRLRAMCLHLDRGPRVRPLFVLAPHALGCWTCFLSAITIRQRGPEVCEACGRPDPGIGVVVAQRGLFVGVGELCASCLAAELPDV